MGERNGEPEFSGKSKKRAKLGASSMNLQRELEFEKGFGLRNQMGMDRIKRYKYMEKLKGNACKEELEKEGKLAGFELRNQMEMDQIVYKYIEKGSEQHEGKLKGNACERELEKEGKLVSLKREIEYKNEQILEIQQRYHEAVAWHREVISGLTVNMDAKHCTLVEMEHLYQRRVQMLVDEKDKLNEVHLAEIRKLRSQNRELDSRLQWKSKTDNDNYLECKRLKKEVKMMKELQGKLRSLESINDALVLKERESRQEIQEARNESITLRKELEGKSETLQSLESLNKTLTDEVSKNRQELQEAREESITLRKELEEKTVTLQSLNRLNRKLERRKLKYGQDLQEALDASKALIKELEGNYLTMEHLKSMNYTMVQRELKCRQDLQEARNESISLKTELNKESEAWQDLESLNNLLVLKESKTRQELQEARNESIFLKTELEKKSEALQNLESLNNILVLRESKTRQELQEARNESITLETDFEEKSEYLESLNNTLILKELITRRELQEARSESITSMNDMLNNRTALVIKRLGEIDRKVFQEACSQKFPKDDWGGNSAKLCSLWEEHLRDANWQPFKTINIKGKLEEIVDEDDERLKELRNEYGEPVYKTVADALLELNEHNPSGRYLIPEIWNPKEERLATMKEIVQYLVKQVKTHKRKR